MLGWVHQDHLRRDGHLSDEDGKIGLIQMGDHTAPELS